MSCRILQEHEKRARNDNKQLLSIEECAECTRVGFMDMCFSAGLRGEWAMDSHRHSAHTYDTEIRRIHACSDDGPQLLRLLDDYERDYAPTNVLTMRCRERLVTVLLDQQLEWTLLRERVLKPLCQVYA
jgi:hypothetical protein